VNRGVCLVDEEMYLKGVSEIVKIAREEDRVIRYPGGGTLSEDTLVSMNIWGFLPSYFEYAENSLRSFLEENAGNVNAELYIPTIIDELISAGSLRVKVLPSDSTWFGVTYREDKPFVTEQITRLIARGKYPVSLWNGF
jgi:hypothetical protein